MPNDEKKYERAVEIIQQALEKIQNQKFTGFREKDKAAWYSPQRDMINLMPSMISAAAVLALASMPEEDQEGLGDLPVHLMAAAKGEEGGNAMIPVILSRAFNQDPNAVSQFMACLGMAVLTTQALLPVFRVQPDGQMLTAVEPSVVWAGILEQLPERFQNRVIRKLQRIRGDAADRGGRDLFDQSMKHLADEFTELDLTPEQETKT